MTIWDSIFKERLCSVSQNTSENLERDSFRLEILFLWEKSPLWKYSEFCNLGGKLLLDLRNLPAPKGTQQIMESSWHRTFSLSSFGLCCYVVFGKFHGYMLPPSSMLFPHTFRFIVCWSPHIWLYEVWATVSVESRARLLPNVRRIMFQFLAGEEFQSTKTGCGAHPASSR